MRLILFFSHHFLIMIDLIALERLNETKTRHVTRHDLDRQTYLVTGNQVFVCAIANPHHYGDR